jgi:hypothetical protein
MYARPLVRFWLLLSIVLLGSAAGPNAELVGVGRVVVPR